MAGHLAKAAQIVSKALPLAEKEHQDHQVRLEQAALGIQAIDESIATTEVDHLIILNAKRRRDAEAINEELRQRKESLSADQLDEHHVEAADLAAIRNKTHKEVNRLQEALLAVDNETAPLRHRIEETRQQFHARCNHELELVKKEKQFLLTAIDEKKNEDKNTQYKLKSAIAKDKAVTARLTELNSSISHANSSLLQLSLEPGEAPEQASERLEMLIQDTKDVIKELEENIAVEGEKQQEHQNAIRDAEIRKVSIDHEQQKLSEWLQKESDLQQATVNNPCLLRLSEGELADPYSDYLLSELRDSLTRKQTEISNIGDKCANLRIEIQRLNKLNTESEDDQLPALLSYYHQKGIKPAKLRSHVEYLDAKLEGDVERIAHFMHQDPGRFIGLMATDQATLTALRDIPTPPGLSRPVIVSLPMPDERTQEPEYAYEVLKPSNLDVYSQRAIEAKRLVAQEELQQLEDARKDRKTELGEYEQAHTMLLTLRQHGQGNDYVAGQKEAFNGIQQTIANLDLSIVSHQAAGASCQKNIDDMQAQASQRKARLIETGQMLKQVAQWLATYQELPAWRQELESCQRKASDMTTLIAQLESEIEQIQQDIEVKNQSLPDIATRQEQVRSLKSLVDEPTEPWQGDLPASGADALQQDFQAAKQTFERVLYEKGHSGLKESLQKAESERTRAQSNLDQKIKEFTLSNERLDHWLAATQQSRDSALRDLKGRIRNSERSIDNNEDRLATRKNEISKAEGTIKNKCRSATPSVTEEQLTQEPNLEGLIDQTKRDKEKLSVDRHELFKRQQSLSDQQKIHNDRLRCVQEAKIRLESYQESSPTDSLMDWPSLAIGSIDDKKAAAIEFNKLAQELAGRYSALDKNTTQQDLNLSRAFSKLTETAKNNGAFEDLQAVTEQVLNTTARNLAAQVPEHIVNIKSVIRNLETGIERFSNEINRAVSRLYQHSVDCYTALEKGLEVKVPNTVPVYADQPILTMTHKLNFRKHEEAYRQALGRWLEEFLSTQRLPQANEVAGNALGASLLTSLLSATGTRVKDSFGLQMIKLDSTANKYVNVAADLSSGGEGLAAATLLYTVIINLRNNQLKHKGNGAAFLIMDNPLSSCNKSSLIKAQLDTCESFNIQPIFFTGIADMAALNEFHHRVMIQKRNENGEQTPVRINGQKYFRCHVIEANSSRVAS
ncbi:hypothetical protein [Endozoicomonas sp. GU-1]|uniref:hypothetical protein n=1 Tax=Endozoicomonas sp. GU-1 TaxID=3009078 RepID=UPI0022B2D723|nr:hypothetical protein [Endozoicomonas sp. GU-1]WBA81440.1 hypothetical protein O2T12_24710 [Endozoicomonas sp. GU-1]WBA84387.1 hypothetical protein O3276_13870 [Endozoicomonas sp. GU-1]